MKARNKETLKEDKFTSLMRNSNRLKFRRSNRRKQKRDMYFTEAIMLIGLDSVEKVESVLNTKKELTFSL